MKIRSISKTVIVLSLLLALAIMNIISYHFRLEAKEQERLAEHSFFSKVISDNEKEIVLMNRYTDSLELEYSRAVAGYRTLKQEYDRLEKSKSSTKENYLKKKPDERAIDFFAITQQDTSFTPLFYKDSLLVPMLNIDNAMSMIYDGIFCDSVLIVKDEEIEYLQTQISRLETLNLLEKDKNEVHKNSILLMQARLDDCAQEKKSIKKKAKVQKVISGIKNVAIIGGLIYILIR